MGMNHLRYIFRQKFRGLGQEDLVYQFRGVVAHNMSAEDLLCLRIKKDLDHAVAFSNGHGFADATVRENSFFKLLRLRNILIV